MSPEPRLLETGGSEWERLLLETARQETPSQDVDNQLLSPLMALPFAGASVSAGAGAKSSALLKVALATTALFAGVGYSVWPDAAPESGSASTWSSTAPEREEASEGTSREQESLRSQEKGQEESQVDATHASPAAGKAASTKTGKVQGGVATPSAQGPAAKSTLAQEMRVLDAARGELKRGDAQAALLHLKRYDQAYPQGVLRQEATVLRVTALKESGQEKEASQLGSSFLEAHPNSAHKRRLESEGDK